LPVGVSWTLWAKRCRPGCKSRDCRSLQSLLARVTNENIGDGLFTFMVVEIVEGGESTLAGAIRVLEQAWTDVDAVLRALRDAKPTT